jgi:hypothetical protein
MSPPPTSSATLETVAFGASWSRSTRLLTMGFLISCAAILGFTYTGTQPPTIFHLTSGLVAGAILLVYWFAPLGYHIDSIGVLIRRRAGRKVMPLESLRAARLMEPNELANSIWRWPAVGGLFGFYGTFESPALGRHQWYASRDEDLVLLQTVHGPVVVSPDEPAAFVRELNQRLRSANRI